MDEVDGVEDVEDVVAEYEGLLCLNPGKNRAGLNPIEEEIGEDTEKEGGNR